VKTVTAAVVTGSVPTNPSDDYDFTYLTAVTIGSTNVNLDFDAGSADL
jgi:aspergillopepsin I